MQTTMLLLEVGADMNAKDVRTLKYLCSRTSFVAFTLLLVFILAHVFQDVQTFFCLRPRV